MTPTPTITDEYSLVGHMALALLFGAVIGLEREWRKKPAGFRTHAFVAGACAGVILIAPALIRELAEGFPSEAIRSDPLNLVHAIFLAVGFIAGGLAIKDVSTREVLNLTTAATLLWASLVGMATAAELYIFAGSMTVLALFVNLVHWPFEN